MLSQSRTSRYEILLKFAKETDAENYEKYRQLLVMDYYIRENAKTRPEFAGAETCDKEFAREFYEKEEETHQYLKNGYAGFDKRKLRKMTHIEKFDFDVLGQMEAKELKILFDYQNRSPLNHQASFQII